MTKKKKRDIHDDKLKRNIIYNYEIIKNWKKKN